MDRSGFSSATAVRVIVEVLRCFVQGANVNCFLVRAIESGLFGKLSSVRHQTLAIHDSRFSRRCNIDVYDR